MDKTNTKIPEDIATIIEKAWDGDKAAQRFLRIIPEDVLRAQLEKRGIKPNTATATEFNKKIRNVE